MINELKKMLQVCAMYQACTKKEPKKPVISEFPFWKYALHSRIKIGIIAGWTTIGLIIKLTILIQNLIFKGLGQVSGNFDQMPGITLKSRPKFCTLAFQRKFMSYNVPKGHLLSETSCNWHFSYVIWPTHLPPSVI